MTHHFALVHGEGDMNDAEVCASNVKGKVLSNLVPTLANPFHVKLGALVDIVPSKHSCTSYA